MQYVCFHFSLRCICLFLCMHHHHDFFSFIVFILDIISSHVFLLYEIISLCYFFLNITINTLLQIFNKKLTNYVDCSIFRNELYLEQQSLITLNEWPELNCVALCFSYVDTG